MKSEKSRNLLSRIKKNTQPLPKALPPQSALCAPLFEKVVKMWTNSGPERDPLLLLACDATPTGYSKQRQEGPWTSTADK